MFDLLIYLFITSLTSSYTHNQVIIIDIWQKLLLIGHGREDTNASPLSSIEHIIQIFGYIRNSFDLNDIIVHIV